MHLFKLSLLSVCYQKIIEEVEEMLNNLPGVTSVHGRFYDLSSKYYRIIGNHAAYYKDALRYLGCVDIKDLPGRLKAWWEMVFFFIWSALLSTILFITSIETEKQERAFTLGLAGLLGEGVYNFGELVGSVCARVNVCALVSEAWTHRCVCSHSWCILCWSLWGTRISSGSLILFTPSMEETWRSSRATRLHGANRWVYPLLSQQNSGEKEITLISGRSVVVLVHKCLSLVAWSRHTWS